MLFSRALIGMRYAQNHTIEMFKAENNSKMEIFYDSCPCVVYVRSLLTQIFASFRYQFERILKIIIFIEDLDALIANGFRIQIGRCYLKAECLHLLDESQTLPIAHVYVHHRCLPLVAHAAAASSKRRIFKAAHFRSMKYSECIYFEPNFFSYRFYLAFEFFR